MIKVDKDKIKMEGVGVDIQCELVLAVYTFASDTAKMSKGKLTKKECAEMCLALIKRAVLHIIEEEGK